MKVSMTVNGRSVDADVEPRTLLVHFIRNDVGLTGTNVGCDTTNCGACTILMDGESVKSCTVLAVQADGASITTIEGLADPDGPMHPMQEAFRENHALQCGYCTPGMVMASISLLNEHPNPSEAEVREGPDEPREPRFHGIVPASRRASLSDPLRPNRRIPMPLTGAMPALIGVLSVTRG